ncbi:MAG: hypothetical protein ACKODK_04280 [Opitutaceae bacterium]
MANNPSSSPAAAKPAAKRKRVGAALVSPFRKLSSRLRPVRASATPPAGTPVAGGPPPEKPADPPAA